MFNLLRRTPDHGGDWPPDQEMIAAIARNRSEVTSRSRVDYDQVVELGVKAHNAPREGPSATAPEETADLCEETAMLARRVADLVLLPWWARGPFSALSAAAIVFGVVGWRHIPGPLVLPSSWNWSLRCLSMGLSFALTLLLFHVVSRFTVPLASSALAHGVIVFLGICVPFVLTEWPLQPAVMSAYKWRQTSETREVRMARAILGEASLQQATLENIGTSAPAPTTRQVAVAPTMGRVVAKAMSQASPLRGVHYRGRTTGIEGVPQVIEAKSAEEVVKPAIVSAFPAESEKLRESHLGVSTSSAAVGRVGHPAAVVGAKASIDSESAPMTIRLSPPILEYVPSNIAGECLAPHAIVFADRQSSNAVTTVKVGVTVSQSGEVLSAQLVDASVEPCIELAAIKAAQKARYRPASRNDHPIEATTTLTFNFTPHE